MWPRPIRAACVLRRLSLAELLPNLGVAPVSKLAPPAAAAAASSAATSCRRDIASESGPCDQSGVAAMRDALCRCDDDEAAAVALVPRTPAAASLGSAGDAADGDLGAQVESLVGLLRSVSGNVECVLETLRNCTDQLQAITLRRKSSRRMRAPLAAGAAVEVKSKGLPPFSSPAPSLPSSGDGRRGGAQLLLLAERPSAIGRRGPGGGGGGLDDAHDLDWDLSGLELGHTQLSQMTSLAVDVSWTADDTGGCDELAMLAAAAPSPQHSHDSRQPLLPAVEGLRCASIRNYEEDMERALERRSASSRDANSDDDEVIVVVDGEEGGGTTGEIDCLSSSASPVSPPPTTTDSSSVERLRCEYFDQHDHKVAAAAPRWDCHDERGCGRSSNYCSADERAQNDRADAICGGGCIVDGCDNDDNDDRVTYDPTVNTWRTYALTCAADRV